MMEDNKHLAQRIDGAIQSASQEVTNLRSELSATSRRLAELGASSPPALENHHQYNHHDDSLHYRGDHPPSCPLSTCRESMQWALTFPLYPSPPEYLTPSPPHIPCLASRSHALSVVNAA
ncbi:hypothetical protein JOQ06_015033 [Pogonophryne albipinna]|uniref:Kazrin n=1 Tax=Pogonophryne albipinna TaxID=1090488 RepID=A0AAD6F2G5_9TELE|nr:hypothetical protein JOQ06_010026 [Pogonophryne albipinna]KAJ4926951.1 hypothetical protein JOQ06_014693 [Pogonophryne albipinna]KAJ4927299.1 hypothetical protein JOQ06_015033 [Pogonophryne albipinna]